MGLDTLCGCASFSCSRNTPFLATARSPPSYAPMASPQECDPLIRAVLCQDMLASCCRSPVGYCSARRWPAANCTLLPPWSFSPQIPRASLFGESRERISSDCPYNILDAELHLLHGITVTKSFYYGINDRKYISP